MSVLLRLRQYHALLGALVLTAYLTGEWGIVHSWLGYGVAFMIVVRLIFALSGAPQLGLFRYYPHFKGLKLGTALSHPAISRTLLAGIAICVIGVTATGIGIDRGHALGMAQVLPAAYADDHGRTSREEHDREAGFLGEVHEVLANLLMMFVILHVSYLLLFKRPLATFMLFLRKPASE